MAVAATQVLQALLGDRYRVERPLGPGTLTSSVWQAKDLEAGRSIAVKWLHASASPGRHAMFEREYHTLATLCHPSIVRVFDYGSGLEGAFYTMELLEGADLSGGGPMPWREACLHLRDLASALALLHTRGLLHRDLSPTNVWRSREGAIKLIDFGAVTSCGVPTEVVGTPPLVPPEAVYGQPLDSRADLYSLGALGYWLITGAHAYPARTLQALPRAWETPPLALSERLQSVFAADGEDALPPEELQSLFDALLSLSASARPGRAAEVIGRLQVIAGIEPEADAEVARSYLMGKPFVGRRGELTVLEEALRIARRGSGRCVVIEAVSGNGRTRLCEELCLRAKLSGTLVVHTQVFGEQRGYGLMEDLGLRLLEAAPDVASRAAQAHFAALTSISSALAARLRGEGPAPGAPGRVSEEWSEEARESSAGRLAILRAFRSWVLEIARLRPLLLAIDDIALADEVSLAALAGLADEVGDAKLLLLATRSHGHQLEEQPSKREVGKGEGSALDGLVHRAQLIELGPLTQAETHDLVGSLFGEVPHLRRVVERIYRTSHGNPAHTSALLEHLVRKGIVRYADGYWHLPTELSQDELPPTRRDVLLEQLAHVQGDERALAQVLSVHDGALTRSTVWQLSELAPRQTARVCELLIRSGILRRSGRALRLVDGGLREELLRELGSGARRRRAHARLGECALARKPLMALDRLQAGAHFLRAGQDRRGAALVVRASVDLQGPAAHVDAVPDLEDAVDLMRRRGFSEYELLAPMARLAATSYYCDRRLAQRYGDSALAVLENALRLPLANRLRPKLGPRLSLFVSLVLAGWAFAVRRRNPCVPTLRQALELLFSAVPALTGVHTVCVDPVSALRSAGVLTPFATLGTDNIAGFCAAYCVALAMTVQERMGEALRAWQPLVRRLQTDPPIRAMPENRRTDFLAGGLYALGALYTLAENSEALMVAEELERLNQGMYMMAADQIRSVYQANLGKVALFREFSQRVEMHAIERGSAWQVETWAAGASIAVQMRANDRTGMKGAWDELRRLAEEIPCFETLAQRAAGATLLLQGRVREAIGPLSACLREKPRETVGWARAHGALARGYNELGEHERAREVCLLVIGQMTEDDLSFPLQHLGLHIELALAEAALGHGELAVEELEHWIRTYQKADAPLTRGALHEARARVALMQGDRAAFETHLRRMQNWYLPTALPDLVQRCQRLAKAGAKLGENSSQAPGLGFPQLRAGA